MKHQQSKNSDGKGDDNSANWDTPLPVAKGSGWEKKETTLQL